MTRIFITLAWLAVVMVAATLLLGLYVGDLHQNPSQDALRWAKVHRLSGLASALAVVLVNSIVVTYFIGTSRWCKEVAETYQLDRSLVVRSTLLKRRTFPWAVMAMLVVVGVGALGAAADPSTLREGTQNWVNVHLIGAIAGLAFIVWAFVMEWQHIAANHLVIADVLEEVRRIRAARGLDVEVGA